DHDWTPTALCHECRTATRLPRPQAAGCSRAACPLQTAWPALYGVLRRLARRGRAVAPPGGHRDGSPVCRPVRCHQDAPPPLTLGPQLCGGGSTVRPHALAQLPGGDLVWRDALLGPPACGGLMVCVAQNPPGAAARRLRAL